MQIEIYEVLEGKCLEHYVLLLYMLVTLTNHS